MSLPRLCPCAEVEQLTSPGENSPFAAVWPPPSSLRALLRSSHIERVCFLADDSRVVSCGGHDQATYQWKVRGPGKPKPEDKVKAATGMLAGMRAFAMAGANPVKPAPPTAEAAAKRKKKEAGGGAVDPEAAKVASAAIESLDNLLTKLESGGGDDGGGGAGGDTAAEIAALRESMQSLGSLASKSSQ